MSRAINHGTKELISTGDHEWVFNKVAGVLSQRLPAFLEIEFLGGQALSDAVFLQDEACVAIPKFRLLQAFIFARRLLLSNASDDDANQKSRAAAVLLLADPEHLTAANTRKRLLLHHLAQDAAHAAQHLAAELYLVDSLLTSRLHRHNKSPTLWAHREWLVERFRDHGADADVDVAETLRAVVLVAAERHARNYYAWGHARYLVGGIETTAEIVEMVKTWSLAHHDDVSGWAFLMFCLDRFPGHAVAVVGETLALATALRWRGESVWYFLRNMVALHEGVRERHGVEFRSAGLALMKGGDEGERRTLERALRWIESPSGEDE